MSWIHMDHQGSVTGGVLGCKACKVYIRVRKVERDDHTTIFSSWMHLQWQATMTKESICLAQFHSYLSTWQLPKLQDSWLSEEDVCVRSYCAKKLPCVATGNNVKTDNKVRKRHFLPQDKSGICPVLIKVQFLMWTRVIPAEGLRLHRWQLSALLGNDKGHRDFPTYMQGSPETFGNPILVECQEALVCSPAGLQS